MVATFLTSFAGGTLMVLGLAGVPAAARRFVRLVAVLAFTAAVGVGVWSVMRGEMAGGGLGLVGGLLSIAASVAAAVVMVAAPVMDRLPRLVRGTSILGGVCGIVGACVWSTLMLQLEGRFSVGTVVGQVFSSLLIGSVTVAWLLGHAYLTATQLPIAPLRRLSRFFSMAVIVRCAYLVVCVLVATLGWSAEGGGDFAARMSALWLILSLRVAVGLFAVGVFAYMVSDCVKLRSTQSATGILYFASVFVYIGELASQHLMTEVGVLM